MYKCGQKENTNYTFGVLKESSQVKDASTSICTCPKCGEVYFSSSKFCFKCGERINESN